MLACVFWGEGDDDDCEGEASAMYRVGVVYRFEDDFAKNGGCARILIWRKQLRTWRENWLDNLSHTIFQQQ